MNAIWEVWIRTTHGNRAQNMCRILIDGRAFYWGKGHNGEGAAITEPRTGRRICVDVSLEMAKREVRRLMEIYNIDEVIEAAILKHGELPKPRRL